ncbi:hypothetical protein ACELLULO517_24435 [Acidisoma cellulosilytica]|uniref:Uncharacterized protein n=1 Tax=Acidisoma cellulosilyticum TaxID=2802395 RepID=A0A963Z7S8_9PROT|nr:hypothetical protein [Acidisoma cellulosilyticum]MCB8883418.1 hypothetical protein [Acidisoma cellulosilyticum]
MIRIDARIPVFLATASDDAAMGVAWLVENPAEASWDGRETGHVAGCACCVARSPVAETLGRLFRARAVGEVPFFTRLGAVPAGPEGEAALRQALETDGLASACYRLETVGASL